MKLIEKTCPNCGAHIDFNKGDKKVKCEYCKKSYLIEEDMEDYTLVLANEVNRSFTLISIFSTIVILLVGFAIFMGTMQMNNKPIQNNEEVVEKVNSFDDISEKTINTIHKKSVEALANESNVTGYMYVQTKPFENVGMYLLLFDGGNALYDVYKATYTIKDESREVYTAFRYEDVSDNNKMLLAMHVPNTNPSSVTFMIGFESEEDLYNSTVAKTKFNKVFATEGLYNPENN